MTHLSSNQTNTATVERQLLCILFRSVQNQDLTLGVSTQHEIQDLSKVRTLEARDAIEVKRVDYSCQRSGSGSQYSPQLLTTA